MPKDFVRTASFQYSLITSLGAWAQTPTGSLWSWPLLTHEIMIKRRLLVYYRCSEEQLPVVAKAGAETDPVRTINNR